MSIVAAQIAASVRDVPDYFRHLKERRLDNHKFPFPHLPSWFALYRSHRKIKNTLSDFISEFSDFGNDMIQLGSAFSELGTEMKKNPDIISNLQQLPPDELKEVWKDAQSHLTGMRTKSFEDIQQDLDDVPLDPETKARGLSFINANEIEFSFFMLVYFPCLFIYQIQPCHLYRKARQGDFGSIEKLLRLDPLMLHDPVIGKQIQAIRLKGKSTSYQRLLEATWKPLKGKLSRKKFTVAMASFISASSSAMNQPLTEPQIRALFDAIAKDAEREPIDTNLPDGSETFAKALQRDRTRWEPLLHPDKKN